MKKTIIATLCVLVVAGVALAIIPTTRDEIHWLWASHKDETTSYESYVKAWPKGRHAVEARALYDERGWAEAQMANTVQGFERCVQLHGEGKHIAEAKNNIESLHWQEATTANTIKSYLGYAANHPQGRFTQQAKTKASALRTDEAPYDAMLRACSEASLKHFLADFPGHKKEAKVQEMLSYWQSATKLNTVDGYKVFLSKYNKSTSGHCLALLAGDKIQTLMERANCREQKEMYHTIEELLSKETKDIFQNRFGDCIRASNLALPRPGVRQRADGLHGFKEVWRSVPPEKERRRLLPKPESDDDPINLSDHRCEYCGRPAVGWCPMRRKYVCETHRYFTQGGTLRRCP